MDRLEERYLLSTPGTAIQASGPLGNWAYQMAVDRAGSMYIRGSLYGSVDFNGDTVADLTSVGDLDAVVVKYAPDGSLVWARRMGGPLEDRFGGIAVDDRDPDPALWSVYAATTFEGTADFGTSSLTSRGENDIALVKLDAAAGGFTWVRQTGGPGYDYAYNSMALGSDGSVHVTGRFDATAQFGAVSLTSAGSGDAYVMKVDGAGDVAWARRMGGTGLDEGGDLAVDTSDNVYVSGNFHGTAQFGGTTLTSQGSGDAFVTKLDSAGQFLAAKGMGGTGFEGSYGIAVDAGAVYVTGEFGGTASFGSQALSSAGGQDAYVARLDTGLATVAWAKRIGGPGATGLGRSITVAPGGDVFVAGWYDGVLDVASGPIFTNAGLLDSFLVRLDGVGNVPAARTMGGPGDDQFVDVVADSSGLIYLCGLFGDLRNGAGASATFDLGDRGVTLTSAGSSDMVVLKTDPSWGLVGGTAFNDLDGDGQDDDGTAPLANRTVFLDGDADGLLDPGEVWTTTDARGAYRFHGLTPGTYRVTQVVPPGWTQTAPAGGASHVVALDSGQTAYRSFGTRTPTTQRT